MDRHQLLLPPPFSSSSMTSSRPIFPLAHSLSGDLPPPQLNFYGSPNIYGGLMGLNSEEGSSLEAKDDRYRLSGCAHDVVAGESGEKSAGKKKARRHKFAFQTRSEVDVLDDGYKWRKYGQKAVKNNKFPRSYYKCTYQGCNVKKQVQRLMADEGVVLTTYEGVHTHQIDKPTDNFEHILSQMNIYHPF
ncbi:hypothetical protein MLD38_000104 [Melastoma candidum]|uniref:Uncharacterized protein n=1 Tax=Melastoma candidum TaxID=119954 RepID=A0ACB9S8A7_9MYRT|nr:hypothetical protein MLD38_000104 [Melastoma candidum]